MYARGVTTRDIEGLTERTAVERVFGRSKDEIGDEWFVWEG